MAENEIDFWCTIEWLQLLHPPHTHARTHAHTHTHTHTHVGFYGLRRLSIGVMVFILYKLYVLLPYTYPTPKLSPHRRRCISTFPPKNSLCMIYKRFKLWGHWKCPHKSPSPCNTYVIPCHYTNLCPHKPHKHAHTHTHRHTHTHIHVCFCELWGLSTGVMVFILYKSYFLSPYT